jgi:hypothetical protein
MATDPILNGSIIQPWLPEEWMEKAGGNLEAHWREELSYMASLKMDHIILQWTIDNTPESTNEPTHPPPHAFYPTTKISVQQPEIDSVHALLVAAKSANFDVWLGLIWNLEWEEKYASDPVWLAKQFGLAKTNATELWDNYRGDFSETIAGFYMPFEMDNEQFVKADAEKQMTSHYSELLDHVHGLGKPLMIPPCFNENVGQAADEYAKMWGRILGAAPVDVLALQDSIGAADYDEDGKLKQHCSVETIACWMRLLEVEVGKASPKTALWSDLETFIDTKKKVDPIVPAPISRVIKQLKQEHLFVRRFTSFSFNHYDSPKKGFKKEFDEYKKYVDESE